jgi:hypothetical protein
VLRCVSIYVVLLYASVKMCRCHCIQVLFYAGIKVCRFQCKQVYADVNAC